jgi:tRNA threonylcarbamoyladenosine biosynthesis protein TsaB
MFPRWKGTPSPLKRMKILSIDTTVVAGSVALSVDAELVAQEQQGASGTHSEKLLTSIDHLLDVAAWEREDIEGIAVAVGPGSFTGLRIGLATAKGIAIALGCPLAGASSLQSLALNGRNFSGTVVSLIDARRGEIYAGAWCVGVGGALAEVMPECVLPPEHLAQQLQSLEGTLLLVGDGALAFGDALVQACDGRAIVAQGGQLRPQAINLAALALPTLQQGGEDISAVVPNYVRRSDAEIGFKGK